MTLDETTGIILVGSAVGVLISCAILFGMASRFALVSVLLAAPACSIMKAAKQPGLKDMSVLKGVQLEIKLSVS